MTLYEFLLICAALVSPLTVIISHVVWVVRKFVLMRTDFVLLKDGVASLGVKVDALAPQAQQIESLMLKVAELQLQSIAMGGHIETMQPQIERIMNDIGELRRHQQLAADDKPEKGPLDPLETSKR